jgi:MazG family protein
MTAHDPASATERLLEVMARLLGPDGCPWDRAQTHRSLMPHLLEEAYELIEAIERDDPAALREELGDVLLQVVFHARLAEQAGAFSFADVADGLAAKLIERHPHVFARERLATAEQVSDAWDRRKLAGRASRLDGIPAALPALMLAQKVGGRAAKAGFEWGQADEIHAKIREELDEFQAAMAEAQASGDQAAAELEFGDLLFALVQVARWSGVDAETALRRATQKFAARFRHMEQALQAEGRDPHTADADVWWALWERAKREQGKG